MIKPVSLSTLFKVHDAMEGRVKYGLGAKAKSLSIAPSKIARIDCSGYCRYELFQATSGDLIIPDGSWHQKAWCEKAGLYKAKRYSDMQYLKDGPPRLFMCFIPPGIPTLGGIGHVWFVTHRNDRVVTLESRGGKGVDSRPYTSATLLKWAASCYELPVTL